jgi:hypothetical protein
MPNEYLYATIFTKTNSIFIELAYSIGPGYPLKGCSSAEPLFVSPDIINVNWKLF